MLSAHILFVDTQNVPVFLAGNVTKGYKYPRVVTSYYVERLVNDHDGQVVNSISP